MVRLREDAANIEASSRDGLISSERKTTDDADEKRFAGPAPLGVTNTDEGNESFTGGNTTSDSECEGHPHENQAHTKTRDSCSPDLQIGGLLGKGKPARVAGIDLTLSRQPSKDKSASVDEDTIDATLRVRKRATDRPNDQGSHYDTAQKQTDQCDATQHALGSEGLANVHLPFKKTGEQVYNTYTPSKIVQGERVAHYVKSEKAVDALEAAPPHPLEDDWQLVQKKPRLRLQGLSRISSYNQPPPPALRPSLRLNGRSAGVDAIQDRHGSGSPPIHQSKPGACLSATGQPGESGNGCHLEADYRGIHDKRDIRRDNETETE